MTKPANEVKAMFAFSETSNSAIFEIVIDGMKVSKKLSNLFVKRPNDASIITSEFKDQSMNYAIEYKDKIHRLSMRRLPSLICPKKTKIEYDDERVTITLKKKESGSWRDYANDDFETDKN